MEAAVADALHFIRTEADYEAVLAEYETYFDREPAPGSAEGGRFKLLGRLLRKHEARTGGPAPTAS